MSRSKIDTCKINSMELALSFIGRKWNSLIIYYLGIRTMRFGELKKMIPGITQKVLTQKLKELAEYGIIVRKIYPEIPPKVEYLLTGEGAGLLPILKLSCEWGMSYKSKRYACCTSKCTEITENKYF